MQKLLLCAGLAGGIVVGVLVGRGRAAREPVSGADTPPPVLALVPQLISAMDSDRLEERALAARRLRRLTGLRFGFDAYSGDDAARQAALDRWRAWWAGARLISPDEWLSDALRDPEYPFRAEAAVALGERAAALRGRARTTAVEALLAYGICDSDVKVRRAAARALAGFDRPGTAPALRILLYDSDYQVRLAAANALASMRRSGGAAVLAAAIDDLSEPTLLQTAALASLAVGDRANAARALARLLEKGDDTYKMWALIRVGEYRMVVLRPLLERLAEAKDEVGERAAKVLRSLEGSEK